MQKHTVYVPAHLADRARDIALDHAGGVTLSPGHRGYWRDDQGVLVADDITLVTVFERGSTVLDRLIALLIDSGESMVAYETAGVPFLTSDRPEVRY